MGPLWSEKSGFRAFFNVFFRMSSKRALPLCNPQSGAIQRNAPFPDPSFNVSRNPWYTHPPLRSTVWVLTERDTRLLAFLDTSFMASSQEPSLHVPPTQLSWTETLWGFYGDIHLPPEPSVIYPPASPP